MVLETHIVDVGRNLKCTPLWKLTNFETTEYIMPDSFILSEAFMIYSGFLF